MSDLPPRVLHVRVVVGRTLELEFTDGTKRSIDVSPYLWGPIFSKIAADDSEFGRVTVDEQLGTIVWPNGADLDPDVLYGAEEPVSAPDASPRSH